MDKIFIIFKIFQKITLFTKINKKKPLQSLNKTEIFDNLRSESLIVG